MGVGIVDGKPKMAAICMETKYGKTNYFGFFP